jgi:hypothetical protein
VVRKTKKGCSDVFRRKEHVYKVDTALTVLVLAIVLVVLAVLASQRFFG